MKKIIFIFIVLATSIWLGLTIFSEPGFVIFAYKQWSVEMPLWFYGFATIILFMIFYALLRLFHHISSIKQYVCHWRMTQRTKKSHQQTEQGLIDLAEGHWQRAEKSLTHAAKYADSPLINYLASARAAQALGANTRRDDYLRHAKAANPQAKLAIALAYAEFELANEQYQHARNTLEPLYQSYPKHTYIIKLLCRIYSKLNDWQAVKQLLPRVNRYDLLSPQAYQALNRQCHIGIINLVRAQGTLADLKQTWRSYSREMTRDIDIIVTYAQALMHHQDQDTAEVLIHKALKRQFNEKLILTYGQLNSSNSQKQLSTAEAWLSIHPNNAALLLSLGQLASANQLWGKAKSYLKNSLEIKPDVSTYLTLAQLLEQLGESEQAAQYYRKGLLFNAKKAIVAP